MPPVLITCPITDSLVPTGVQVTGKSEVDELPDANLLIACSDCGRDHEWSPQDAMVAPD